MSAMIIIIFLNKGQNNGQAETFFFFPFSEISCENPSRKDEWRWISVHSSFFHIILSHNMRISLGTEYVLY